MYLVIKNDKVIYKAKYLVDIADEFGISLSSVTKAVSGHFAVRRLYIVKYNPKKETRK